MFIWSHTVRPTGTQLPAGHRVHRQKNKHVEIQTKTMDIIPLSDHNRK